MKDFQNVLWKGNVRQTQDARSLRKTLIYQVYMGIGALISHSAGKKRKEKSI